MALALALLTRGDRLTERAQPPLAQWLVAMRKRKRFSQPELGAAAGVSKGYVSQLEDGYDSRTGKLIEPSPRMLRQLAAAFSEDDPEQAARYYREMMDLAGYLPHDYFPELFDPHHSTPGGSLIDEYEGISLDVVRRLPEQEASQLWHYIQMRIRLLDLASRDESTNVG